MSSGDQTSNGFISEEQAQSQFQIGRWCLWTWRRKGCVALGGAKFRTKKTGGQRLYSREDLERIAAVPLSTESYRDGQGRLWLASGAACAKYGFTKQSLAAWREEGVAAWGGKRLYAKERLVRSGWYFRTPYFYLDADLKKVHDVRESGPGASARCQWVSAAEAEQVSGYTITTLWKWMGAVCPYLGRKLRTKMEYLVGDRDTIHRVRATKRRLFFRDDLKAIARKSKPPRRSPPKGRWVSAVRAEQEYGFPYTTMVRWHEQGCAYLGGRKLRALDVLTELDGRRVRDVRHYHRDDLDVILGNKPPRHDAPHSDPDGTVWLPFRKAASKYGVPVRTIRSWAEAGRVRTKQIERHGKWCSRGRLMVCHDEDVAKQLGQEQPPAGSLPGTARGLPDELRPFDQRQGGGINTAHGIVLPHRLESVSGQAAKTIAEHIWGARPDDGGSGQDKGAVEAVRGLLQEADWNILKVLQESPHGVMEQIDIETALRARGARQSISKNTLSARLQFLRKHHLIHHPRGNRGGAALTDLARKLLSTPAA